MCPAQVFNIIISISIIIIIVCSQHLYYTIYSYTYYYYYYYYCCCCCYHHHHYCCYHSLEFKSEDTGFDPLVGHDGEEHFFPDTTLLFKFTVQKYIYPSVCKVHGGSFRVSVIHRTVIWTTGSLTTVRT